MIALSGSIRCRYFWDTPLVRLLLSVPAATKRSNKRFPSKGWSKLLHFWSSLDINTCQQQYSVFHWPVSVDNRCIHDVILLLPFWAVNRQLNRWPCHWLSEWVTETPFDFRRATLKTCYLETFDLSNEETWPEQFFWQILTILAIMTIFDKFWQFWKLLTVFILLLNFENVDNFDTFDFLLITIFDKF